MNLRKLLGHRDPFKPSEERIAVLSTGHITKRDAEMLDLVADDKRHLAPFIIYPHGEYGWLINAVQTSFDLEQIERDGYSQDFQRLLQDAEKHGYSWLLLDRDGTAYPNYPTHDW